MAIYAKQTGGGADFVPAPTGTHAAVCVDVVDLGVLETRYQDKVTKQHKVRIVWQIDELRDDGKPYTVNKRYTLSLHEKAALRKDLESWRGRPFTKQELEGFDLENLLSVAALVSVIHAAGKNGGTFANVSALMKLPKMMMAPTPRDYVRVCDRTPEDQQSAPSTDAGGWDPTDDDVPF